MKKIKLLFQGDSITDWGRDYSDCHNLGNGYPKYAAESLKKLFPQIDFEFINLGIGGNETTNLVERLQKDFIDIQPDIVSIMIGINDVWHFADKEWFPDDAFESNYRTVLKEIREKTSAKIIMIEPFLLPVEDKLFFREDLYKKIEIERKLAREFADIYIPMDGLISSALVGKEISDFTLADGVHLNDSGIKFMADIYADYASKLIEEL